MKGLSILFIATGPVVFTLSTADAFLNSGYPNHHHLGGYQHPIHPASYPSSSSSSLLLGHVLSMTSTSLRMTSPLTEVIPDRQLVYQGMEAYRNGDIKGSIAKFDASVPAGSPAYLWQRGISYYYNEDFALGSKQFRDDVLRSPLDVEEIVWDIACLLRMTSGSADSSFPPPNMLSLPSGKRDRRPIMVRCCC
jgi:hypothetical protein